MEGESGWLQNPSFDRWRNLGAAIKIMVKSCDVYHPNRHRFWIAGVWVNRYLAKPTELS
jgi:hypothetical protein